MTHSPRGGRLADAEGEREDEDDMEIDNSTAEDNDIDPSCYVLDIDIRGIENKIWLKRHLLVLNWQYLHELARVFGAGTLYEGAQPTSFHAQCYKTVIWTLVDSVDAPSGPPIRLITHGSQTFLGDVV
ncbi:hypothetical protein M378DRAFT_13336 [Amanita muscaria Koide BX008]|uniref:Uncharacterized protein n=1 Tax=Amanita muscaria (strain Koide BX008) TaxID=946122 RepID=A0A0C2T5C9_AMAMK|nr:hypothetical protein M378DRAFT_13336 [Amanita muscaria Koide BX008]